VRHLLRKAWVDFLRQVAFLSRCYRRKPPSHSGRERERNASAHTARGCVNSNPSEYSAVSSSMRFLIHTATGMRPALSITFRRLRVVSASRQSGPVGRIKSKHLSIFDQRNAHPRNSIVTFVTGGYLSLRILSRIAGSVFSSGAGSRSASVIQLRSRAATSRSIVRPS